MTKKQQFEEFMVDEYGKWKIGRAEAWNWIESQDKQQKQDIIKMIEGEMEKIDLKKEGFFWHKEYKKWLTKNDENVANLARKVGKNQALQTILNKLKV